MLVLLASDEVWAEADGPAGNLAPEEVIVTARKKPESILKVPVVEIAVSQQKLADLQVTEIADLPKLVPGLDMGQNILTIGTQVAIRGVGTTAYDQGVDQSVALNIDGVGMGSGLAFQSGLFDVGSVEVLKGPQSLFYGKSTTAGVIALRTTDPTSEVEVIGRGEYEAEANTWRGEGVLSGPVADTLKMRLAAQYTTSDGYFEDRSVPLAGTGALGPRYDHGPHLSNDYKVRLTALWDPTEQISARFKANLTSMDVTDPSPTEEGNCQGPVGGVPPLNIAFIGPYNDCRLSRNYYVVGMDPTAFPGVMNGGVPFLDTRMDFGSLDLTYRPTHEVSLTSTTGYYWIKAQAAENAIQTTYAGTPIAAENDYRRHAWSEEVRATSDFTVPVNFTAGGYYENGLVSNEVTYLGNAAFKLPSPLQESFDAIRIRSYSAFGQIRYRMVSQLELAAGLRWTHEIRSQAPINVLTGLPIPGQTPQIHSSQLMPEFTATYTPTDDLTLFAAYKKGFKSGSFSIATPVVAFVDNAFGDESARGGEVGMKSRWLDRRLLVNLAAYLYNYDGLQVGTTQPPENGVLITRTLNAGAARTYGIDSDVSYRPAAIEHLQLNGAMNWNHARYTQLNDVPCWATQTVVQGCNQNFNPSTGLYSAQNLSGAQMVRAPQWQMNLGLSYDLTLPSGHKLTLTNANSYFSRYPIALAMGRPNGDQYQTSFAKIDLGAELTSPSETWTVAVIGKNINDKITTGTCSYEALTSGVIFPGSITGGASPGPGGTSSPVCFVDPGREVWIRFTVKPFAGRR